MNSQQIKTFFLKFVRHYDFNLTVYYLYGLILLSKMFNIIKGTDGRPGTFFFFIIIKLLNPFVLKPKYSSTSIIDCSPRGKNTDISYF